LIPQILFDQTSTIIQFTNEVNCDWLMNMSPDRLRTVLKSAFFPIMLPSAKRPDLFGTFSPVVRASPVTKA